MRATDIKLAKTPAILIVEDDADQRRLMSKFMCQAFPCDLQETGDGLEALQVLLKDKQVPDLVLLDLMLPYLSGVEFLSILRGRTEFDHLPIVVCTSVAETSEINRKIVNQIHSYLVKPINREKLLQKVLDALRPIRFRVDYHS